MPHSYIAINFTLHRFTIFHMVSIDVPAGGVAPPNSLRLIKQISNNQLTFQQNLSFNLTFRCGHEHGPNHVKLFHLNGNVTPLPLFTNQVTGMLPVM